MHESEKSKWSCSVVSNSSRPQGLQPTRLLRPWDFPGKRTGMGCHCLLLVGQAIHIYIERQTDIHSSFQGTMVCFSFPGGLNSKEYACNAKAPSSIPGLGRSPGERNGYPLQYSCLENSMDRGAWWATVHGVTKSGTWLSNQHTHGMFHYRSL